MGIGDSIMATGMARGAAKRNRRIAFGDPAMGKICWDNHSELVFLNNPNIARPGWERLKNLEWIEYYKGNRIYNKQADDHWIWNYDFRAVPGEFYLTRQEQGFASRAGSDFILIEPNVPVQKAVAPNKQWPVERYDEIADRLKAAGHDIVQMVYSAGYRLKSARVITTHNFRYAAALMGRARLYIGPEGGLHHAAAAMGKPGVVLFGGFVPPQVTGYDSHINLTGGAEACGRFKPCEHCKRAMQRISVDEVEAAATTFLSNGNRK